MASCRSLCQACSIIFFICMCNWWFFNESGMPYSPGPAVNGYGFGFQRPPWAGGVLPDNPASRKRRGGICTILYPKFYCF